MWWFVEVLIFYVCFIQVLSTQNLKILENEPHELADILFENLRADPKLTDDNEASEKSKVFIDEKINNFMQLMLTNKEKFSRSRRSLKDEDELQQNYSFDIKVYKTIPSKSPIDLVTFNQNFTDYVVLLEDVKTEQNMVILKEKENGELTEIFRKKVINSQNVAVFSLHNFTIIAVSEHISEMKSDEDQIKILKFDVDEKIHSVQNIKWAYASHIAIWKTGHDVFMSLTQSQKNELNSENFEAGTGTLIYKWRTTYFDLVQSIETSGLKRITPFTMNNYHFIALVNSEAYNGLRKPYSVLMKYDVHKELYVAFQKILSSNCRDIKYFEINQNGEMQHFLVVANANSNNIKKDDSKVTKMKPVIYKFVQNYFIPFQSLPVDNVIDLEPIVNTNGNVIIIVGTHSDTKIFQYNGWNFVNISPASLSKILSTGTRILYSYDKNDTSVVVVADRQNEKFKLFEITFFARNEIRQLHDNLLSWCKNSLKKIGSHDELDVLTSKSLRGDLNQTIEDDEKNELTSTLHAYNHIINDIEANITKSLRSNRNQVTLSNLITTNLIVNNATFITSVTTNSINNKCMEDILEHTLNINDGFSIDTPIEFKFLFSEESVSPKTINGIPSTKFVRNSDNINSKNMLINGTATFTRGVTIKEKINNMRFTKENILLNNENQMFDSMKAINLKINRLETPFLNKLKLDSAKDMFLETLKIKEIESLHVNNVAISGLINGLNLSSLEKYTLKKSGNQNVTATYYFDNLKTTNFNIRGQLSEINVPNELLSIKNGNCSINQDVIFKNKLSVNNLTVVSNLNNIKVNKNGRLDVVLKDSAEIQEISSEKTFKSLNIENPIFLTNRIKSKNLDNIYPLKMHDTNIVKDSDVIISGNVLLKKSVEAKDIITKNQKYSLKHIQEHGLKLNDSEVPVHLTFSEAVNSDQIFADKINNVEPRTWVVNDVNQTQIIQGWKQFKGDLRIIGPTNVFYINNVNVPQLEATTLKIQGDQFVTGLLEIQYATAYKGMVSNNTQLGEHSWDDLITTTKEHEEILGSTVINGHLVANNIEVNNIEVAGLVNKIPFIETVSDFVKKHNDFKVFGHKNFSELTVHNLIMKNPEVVNQMESVQKNEVKMDSNFNFENDVSVKNIEFSKYLNNITKEEFEKFSVENDSLVINGDLEYDKVIVFGSVIVNSNEISNVNLTRIFEDTVKIDEPFEFNSLTTIREGVVVRNQLDIKGNIENIDIENIFAPTANFSIIGGSKVFQENVEVDGIIKINDLLNGFNLTKYCQYSDPNLGNKTLIVKGNAFFGIGPNIFEMNGNNVGDLLKSAWFVDRSTLISGKIEFKDIHFENNVTVKGTVDGVDLKLLSENYFSKSKNQSVLANLKFSGEITFEKNVSVPEITLDGRINDININKFIDSVLLNGTEQIFENLPFFENFFVKGETHGDEYLVNGLSLQNDVMRYDKENKVTGAKHVKNLEVDILRVNKNVKVQNTDIIDFFENAVPIQGTFSISAKKIFNKVLFKEGISLQNMSLNNQEFSEDTVLLKNTPQIITGKKIFTPSSDENNYFKALKVKGFLNDIELVEFLNYQAYKSHDNVFKSRIDFQNDILTNDLHIDGTFNEVNVTKLVKSISSLSALENLVLDYQKLLDVSNKIKVSIQNQAFFLKYYKETINLSGNYKVLGVTCGDDITRLIGFTYINGTNFALPYEWNEYAEQFLYQSYINMDFCPYPTYLGVVDLKSRHFIYIESQVVPATNNGQTHIGKLVYFANATHIEEFDTIPGSGTSLLKTFTLQPLNQDCMAFVDTLNTRISIICYDSDDSSYLLQDVLIDNIYMVSFEVIDNESYLIAAKTGTLTSEPAICIWKFNANSNEFVPHRHIYEGDEPKSLTSVTYNGITYLAVGYGHLANTMHLGRISIRKFNKNSKEFVHSQNIKLNAPVSTEFAVLPSNELVLYVLTEDTSKPFIVYAYEGISGFKKSFAGSSMQRAFGMTSFSTTRNQHFVIMQLDQESVSVIQAKFKGIKWQG